MAYKQKVYMPIKTQKSSARYLSSVKLLLNKYHILFHKIQFLIINQAFQNKKKILICECSNTHYNKQ